MKSTSTQNITLNGISYCQQQLADRINAANVHDMAQRYLEKDINSAVGEFFRIVVNRSNEPAGEYYKAYFCQYLIIKIDSDQVIYESKKLEYHNNSTSDGRNAGNYLQSAAIIEDTESAITYAFKTGADELKIFKFEIADKHNDPEELTCLKKAERDSFKYLVRQRKSLAHVLEDKEVFRKFIAIRLKKLWQVTPTKSLLNEELCITVTKRWSKRLGAGPVIAYKVHIWNRMRGMSITEEFYTGFKEAGRYNSVDISFDATVSFACEQLITLRIEVFSRQKPNWKKIHILHVFRERPGMLPFEYDLKEDIIKSMKNENQKFTNAKVLACTIDVNFRCAAWLLVIESSGSKKDPVYKAFTKHGSAVVQRKVDLTFDKDDLNLVEVFQPYLESILDKLKTTSSPRKVMTG